MAQNERFKLLGAMAGTAVVAFMMSILAGQTINALFPQFATFTGRHGTLTMLTIWLYAPLLAALLGFLGTGLALTRNLATPRNTTARCLIIGCFCGLIPGSFFTLLLLR